MKNNKFENIILTLQTFRDERDWKQFHDPKNLAEGISIEAGELLELFLWKDKKEIQELLTDKKYQKEIADELADILSFVLLLAETVEIDLEEAIYKKIKQNSKKYPVEKAKGKAVKYTKL